MMFLSVIIVLLGIIMPYLHLMSNILEITLSAAILTLLLIRNADNNAFNVARESDIVSMDQLCFEGNNEVSSLSYLLIIPYYIPMLLVTLAILYWLTSSLR